MDLMYLIVLLCSFGKGSSGTTESVVFQHVDEIFSSISSWILTSSVDFTPYLENINKIQDYANIVKLHAMDQKNFLTERKYLRLMQLTIDDMDTLMGEIANIYDETAHLVGQLTDKPNATSEGTSRNKRSLLPFGGLFHFLFGTGDQKDINRLKSQVKTIYQNQLNQQKVIADVISITNVTRGLVNENREMINRMTAALSAIRETLVTVGETFVPLYRARRFLQIFAEYSIHQGRIRALLAKVKEDMNYIKT